MTGLSLDIELMTPLQRILLRLQVDKKFRASVQHTLKKLGRRWLIEMRLGRKEAELTTEEIDSRLGWR